MRVHSLGHVVLNVRNLERSVPFYRDVLGLKQLGQHGEKMVFFSGKKTRVFFQIS